jgi:hypothetical protein
VAINIVSGVPWLLLGRRLKAEATVAVWDLNEPNYFQHLNIYPEVPKSSR